MRPIHLVQPSPQFGTALADGRDRRFVAQFFFYFGLLGHEETDIAALEALGGLRCLPQRGAVPLFRLASARGPAWRTQAFIAYFIFLMDVREETVRGGV